MPDIYPTKRDAWIVALIWAGAIVAVGAGVMNFRVDVPLWQRVATLAGSLAAAGFMLWVLYGTAYQLGRRRLRIVCGPFRFHVPYTAITRVEPTRNPLSSPACSIDRLRICWGEGSRSVMISPAEKQQFLREPHQFLRWTCRRNKTPSVTP